MAKTGEAYAAARAQLTKPARGERFETAVAGDGSPVFRMFTKLQTPEKGWSGERMIGGIGVVTAQPDEALPPAN